MEQSDAGHKPMVPCCPELATTRPCDAVDLQYRLVHRVLVDKRPVLVEVTLHVRFERCAGPMVLGDLAYTTTLFPGESVKLFTSDHRSRFTYDASSELSYRHEKTSEESAYTSSWARSMSDLTVNQSGSSSSSFEEDWSSGGGGASFNFLGIFEIGGGGGGGSYDAESTSQFASNLSRHASASSSAAATSVRKASATSVGEVQTRNHAEGETEAHFESSSRTFRNPNRCHAVTYYFYRLDKVQTVRFVVEAVTRRVIDPAAPTEITTHAPLATGGVSVVPQSVLATQRDRAEIEQSAQSAAERRQALKLRQAASAAAFVAAAPLSAVVRRDALAAVDRDLVAQGLIDAKSGEISQAFKQRLEWTSTVTLPTPGLMVKGCLDTCDVCEPALHTEIELDLEHKRLKNELLKRQIELLDKAAEYRCCPCPPAVEG